MSPKFYMFHQYGFGGMSNDYTDRGGAVFQAFSAEDANRRARMAGMDFDYCSDNYGADFFPQFGDSFGYEDFEFMVKQTGGKPFVVHFMDGTTFRVQFKKTK